MCWLVWGYHQKNIFGDVYVMSLPRLFSSSSAMTSTSKFGGSSSNRDAGLVAGPASGEMSHHWLMTRPAIVSLQVSMCL